jgi:amino acid transporter
MHAGLPDNDYLSHNSSLTQTPLRAIWFSTLISIIPGLLDLASPIAAEAIFALTAMALDLSYIIPIFLCAFVLPHTSMNYG